MSSGRKYDNGKTAFLEMTLEKFVAEWDGILALSEIPDKYLEQLNTVHMDVRSAILNKSEFPALPMTGSAVVDALKALEYGARKYELDNWKQLENGLLRYGDALLRHWRDVVIYGFGSKDEESGLLHLGHVWCNVRFVTYFLEEDK